jgi:predicted protein tyrosine phosphatase
MQGGFGRNTSLRADNAASAAEGRAIYLRGIPPAWTVEHLCEYLVGRWPVESINLLPLKPGQRTRAAFVNFHSSHDAAEAETSCDGEIITDNGNKYWLGCSLKKSANQKVDVSHQDYTIPSEILEDFLFLGNRACLGNESELMHLGISHVLSIVSDHEDVKVPKEMQHLRLSAEDSEKEDISRLFASSSSFIENARGERGRILVHCIAGRSRSVSIVIAYLMQHRQMTLDSAFELVKAKRPFAWPNEGFWEQLQAEERRLFRKASSGLLRAGTIEVRKHLASTQLPEGSLSRGRQQLLDQFLCDLQHFSAKHEVKAQAEISQDRIDVYASDLRQTSWCLSELEEILEFYSFKQVQWHSQGAAEPNVSPNISRW